MVPPTGQQHVSDPAMMGAGQGALQGSAAGRGLSGLFISGILMSLLGAVLPAWRYHIAPNYLLIGTYFLCQNVGILAGAWLGMRLIRRKGIAFTLSLGAGVAAAALVLLAFSTPPVPFWWRLMGLLLVGFGAGAQNTAAFHAMSAAYQLNKAAAINLGGAMFGMGCLVCALFVSGTFFAYSVQSVLLLLAVAPLLASIKHARWKTGAGTPVEHPAWREVVRDFRSPAAILFTLLLFFQFGNEGALAGWLALFLTQRLGVSPETSLLLLALYWAALLVGRVGAQWLLPRVSHARLLACAVVAPMFACLVLLLTNNLFGATVGVLLAGGGFAVILPLVMEKIGDRFPYFHPGFFNGIFSLALTGGLLAPASVGYFAHYLGIGVLMGLPLIGSVMVLLLLLLILLEDKLSAA
ncbi:MAG: MFS transporter [Acidobacteria bacterium]|nr:MFS transporter [Acidobacteriota bacterium]